jgi:hypothetical protein
MKGHKWQHQFVAKAAQVIQELQNPFPVRVSEAPNLVQRYVDRRSHSDDGSNGENAVRHLVLSSGSIA